MKIALCVSGKPTGYDITFPFLRENIIKDRDVDIFLHCWDEGGAEKKKILSLYRPVAYEFENIAVQDAWPTQHNLSSYTNQLPGVNPINVFGQMYTIYKANELKRKHEKHNKVKYDAVIKYRFDLAIEQRLPIEEMDLEYCWFSPHGPRGMPRDFFCIASSENMDKYASTFTHLKDYYFAHNVPICGEEMIFHNARQKGLIPRTVLIRNGLYRPPGHHQGDGVIVHFPPIL
tara:strand:- start:1971 stop:2663 length:693 start_codon:yes stop_codon:yes gene_type:complete